MARRCRVSPNTPALTKKDGGLCPVSELPHAIVQVEHVARQFVVQLVKEVRPEAQSVGKNHGHPVYPAFHF